MQLPNFFNGVVFVHGFTGRGLREETKRKTQLWLIEEGLAEWKSNVPTGTTAGPIEPYFELKRRPENNARGGYRYPVVGMVVFVESLPPHLRTWADRPDRVRFVDYKQIKDIKLTATPRKKADSRWRIATTAGNERKVEQFTTAPGAFPVVYTLAGERPEPMLLAEVAETAQLAIVETHRKAKFLREYPDAEELGEYVKRLVKELEEDITPEAAFLMDDKGRQEFGKWDVITLPSLRRKLVDLELRTILERFAASAQDGLRADRLFQLARRLGLGGMLPDLKAKAAPARDNLQMIARRYPVLELFQYHGGSRRAELVIQALNNEYLVNS